MNALEVRGVTSPHDGAPAINDLHLHVGAGEIVALVGPNGGGKTSTIRMIAGLAPVAHGSIRIMDRDVTGVSPRARARLGLATVPDHRGVLAQLTCAENLRVGSRRGRPTLVLEDWASELVPLLRRRAGLLSGGEQTMLALARALNSRPCLLVVDELTIGLAPVFVDAASNVMRRAASEWGTGVLVADQRAEVAIGLADRVVVARRGAVVFEGEPADLIGRPGLVESIYMGTAD